MSYPCYLTPDAHGIDEAADLLRKDYVVALPTETVYGLAGNALSSRAVQRIFATKQRPTFNPLIAHFYSLDQVQHYCALSPLEDAILARFAPGPMTLVCRPKQPSVFAPEVTAGLPRVAVRIPQHHLMHQVIRVCGFPVAAPSANLSERLSPTSPAHVAAQLPGVPVMNAEPCTVGVESTILCCEDDQLTVLRPGAISVEDIADQVGCKVRPPLVAEAQGDGTITSPGQMRRHYSPRTPLRLEAIEYGPREGVLTFGGYMLEPRDKSDASLKTEPGTTRVLDLSPTGDLAEAARNLYAYLYRLDQQGYDSLAVAPIPREGMGAAINDRLCRAARRG